MNDSVRELFDDDHYRDLDPQPMYVIVGWAETAGWRPRFVWQLGEIIACVARCFRKGQLRRDLMKARGLLDAVIQDLEDEEWELACNYPPKTHCDNPPDGWIDYGDDMHMELGEVTSFEELGNTLDEEKKAVMRAKTREDMLNIEPISDEEKAMLLDKWNAERGEVKS